MKKEFSSYQRGFTLLEILVALAVITIALSAIISEGAQSLNNAAQLRDKTFAHWVALNKVKEWQISDQWPKPGQLRGEMLMAEREWFWRITVRATEDKDVQRLDVEVRKKRNDELPKAGVIAYLGRPGGV